MRSSVLYFLIAVSGMVFGAEIVASHITQSIVLLISAYHMLYNILSLLLLVISHRMSKGKTLKNTFGWARVKVLGQLVNMLFLGALCFAASVSAVQTMVHASHEDTTPMYPMLLVVLGVINFFVNVLCFFLIGGECTPHPLRNTLTRYLSVEVNIDKWLLMFRGVVTKFICPA
ncbi:zinc transporter 1 [Caerostris extrusa]|uniref:Zinc transporter 1 n=1 Tax=Caerostris extrusa TaxID=172846 RepID=A0AAV4XYF3_CAEEX|nr:zinc transporter 1 [Caerostris extrusa]